MSDFLLDKDNEALTKEHDRLFSDLCNDIGDRKTNLLLILEIERELGRREEGD
jgi:hypothetical protein